MPIPSFDKRPLVCLALGMFAIGMESFMIAGLLPQMASDLAVSLAAAGQLVAVFTLAYSLGSPLIAAFTGSLNRQRVLILAMALFALGNLLACVSQEYWHLMGARILMAFSAGLFSPNANALASLLAPPEKRGRALAIVNGGMSLAIILGVPLGTWLGSALDWRVTFAVVGVIALCTVPALRIGLPKEAASPGMPVSLSARLQLVRNPVVLGNLLVTFLWGAGTYTLVTYLASYLDMAAGLQASQIGPVQFLWGVAAWAGLFIGGIASDRYRPRDVVIASLAALALIFLSFYGLALAANLRGRLLLILAGVAGWGLGAWAFFPAQQSRLIGITGVQGAPIVLSLNASFQYAGFSLGAALGGIVATRGSAADLGWLAALFEAAALLVALGVQLPWRRPFKARNHSSASWSRQVSCQDSELHAGQHHKT